MGRNLTRRGLLGAAALAGAAALPACSGTRETPGGYGVGEVAPAADRWRWPGRAGIADASGEWVVTPRWHGRLLGELAVSAAGDTAAVRAMDGRGRWMGYGYVGCDGSWVVAPSLDDARGFSACGLAVAQAEGDDGGHGNDWGYLAPDGSWALGPGFSMGTGDFGADGTALANSNEGASATSVRWIGADGSDADPSLPWAVEQWPSAGGDGLWGLRDQGGSWVLEPSLAGLCPLLAERAYLAQDPSSGLWGVLAPDGSWAVGPRFQQMLVWDGVPLLARDPSSGLWGMADASGSWLAAPALSQIMRRGDGTILAKDAPSGLWGVASPDGSWLLAPVWKDANFGYHDAPRHMGDALLAQDPSSGLWGVASPDGSWEVGPSFRAVCDYAGGRVVAGATKDGPWGVASPDGSWLTEPAYSDVQWMSAADVFLVTMPEEDG